MQVSQADKSHFLSLGLCLIFRNLFIQARCFIFVSDSDDCTPTF